MQWSVTIENVELTVQSINGGIAWDYVNKRLIGGADALIYVVDSQAERVEANEEKRDQILEQFASTGPVPLVIQWNKRDLPNALPVADLSPRFNAWGAPEFETVATKGIGVLEAFRSAFQLARNRRSQR